MVDVKWILKVTLLQSPTEAETWNTGCVLQHHFVRGRQSHNKSYLTGSYTEGQCFGCLHLRFSVLIHHDNAYARWRYYEKKTKGRTETDEVTEKNTTHTCCYLISINNTGEGNNTLLPLSSIFFPSDTPDKIMLELPVVSEKKTNPKTMNKILVKIAFFIWIM